MSNRLRPILPYLISNNQYRLVKGSSIFENIMLAEKIIHQIKKPNIGSNVITKLDMTKDYERVSLSYIFLVMRNMGFAEMFIDMVWIKMAKTCTQSFSMVRDMVSFIPLDVSRKVIYFLHPYLS